VCYLTKFTELNFTCSVRFVLYRYAINGVLQLMCWTKLKVTESIQIVYWWLSIRDKTTGQDPRQPWKKKLNGNFWQQGPFLFIWGLLWNHGKMERFITPLVAKETKHERPFSEMTSFAYIYAPSSSGPCIFSFNEYAFELFCRTKLPSVSLSAVLRLLWMQVSFSIFLNVKN